MTRLDFYITLIVFEEPIINQDVIEALGNHAQQVAKLVLDQQGAGHILEDDIKVKPQFSLLKR
jgi:hypothetical protein